MKCFIQKSTQQSQHHNRYSDSVTKFPGHAKCIPDSIIWIVERLHLDENWLIRFYVNIYGNFFQWWKKKFWE